MSIEKFETATVKDIVTLGDTIYNKEDIPASNKIVLLETINDCLDEFCKIQSKVMKQAMAIEELEKLIKKSMSSNNYNHVAGQRLDNKYLERQDLAITISENMNSLNELFELYDVPVRFEHIRQKDISVTVEDGQKRITVDEDKIDILLDQYKSIVDELSYQGQSAIKSAFYQNGKNMDIVDYRESINSKDRQTGLPEKIADCYGNLKNTSSREIPETVETSDYGLDK